MTLWELTSTFFLKTKTKQYTPTNNNNNTIHTK